MKRFIAILLTAAILACGMTVFAKSGKLCPDCNGKGESMADCKSCYNGAHDGKCAWCYGTGWFEGEVGFTCNNCHGTGKCPKCDGTGLALSACATCDGTGYVGGGEEKKVVSAPFAPAEKVFETAEVKLVLKEGRKVNVTEDALSKIAAYLDKQYLNAEDFTVAYDQEANTLSVTLSEEYMKTLSSGVHDIRLFFMGYIYNSQITA